MRRPARVQIPRANPAEGMVVWTRTRAFAHVKRKRRFSVLLLDEGTKGQPARDYRCLLWTSHCPGAGGNSPGIEDYETVRRKSRKNLEKFGTFTAIRRLPKTHRSPKRKRGKCFPRLRFGLR